MFKLQWSMNVQSVNVLMHWGIVPLSIHWCVSIVYWALNLGVKFATKSHKFAMGFPRLSRVFPQINRLVVRLCIKLILSRFNWFWMWWFLLKLWKNIEFRAIVFSTKVVLHRQGVESCVSFIKLTREGSFTHARRHALAGRSGRNRTERF